MNSKKVLFVVIGIFIFVVAGLYIYNLTTKNYVKYYTANVDIDDAGNAAIKETFVYNFKSYYNYIYRDMNYAKMHESDPLYSGISSNLYYQDKAQLDTNSIIPKVYRGDLIDNPKEALDISDDVVKGYSFNNDVNKYGERIDCYCGNISCSSMCESVYLDATDCGSFDGYITFVYEYTIYGLITSYNDCAELYYKMFGDMEFEVKTAAVTINLPSSSLDKNDFYCYGHGLSNGKVTQVDNHTFDYLAKNVKTSEFFEVRVVFPNTILSNINEKNIVKTDLKNVILEDEAEAERATILQGVFVTIINVLTIVIVIAMIVVTIIVYRKYDKEYVPTFDKEYLRELPYNYSPAIMSYLYYFGKTNDEDVTATLLDLVRRGYLELITTGDITAKDPDFTIKIITNKDVNELKPHERALIDWFIKEIGNGEEVTIDQIESYGTNYKDAEKFQKLATNFQRTIADEGKNFDFFINTAKAKAKVSFFGFIEIILGVILLLIGQSMNISLIVNLFAIFGSAIIYLIYVASIKKRSVEGNEQFAKWSAFKRFLCDFGSFKDYPMPGIIVWEEFLVYATSLKIADKVMEQLKVNLPNFDQSEATFMRSNTITHRYYVFNTFNRVNHSFSRARMNSVSTIAAHNAKNFSGGGGGHGGGFSGGGGFGGGGGGMRGGR